MDENLKTLESELKTLGVNLKKMTDDNKTSAETYMKEVKSLGDATKETKENADKALTAANTVAAQMAEVQQAVARLSTGGRDAAPKSAGETFVESDAFKNADRRASKFSIIADVKQATVTSATSDAAGSAGAGVPVDRQPGVVVPALRRLTIRALLLPGQTSSNNIEYVREKGYTDGTAIQVTEGSSKGQSDIQLELKHAPVVTIAAFMRASKQIMDDALALKSLIDYRLRYGLGLKEEAQLLNGDGAGGNITGLMTVASAFNPAFHPAFQTRIDEIRLAMLQASLAEWPATGTVMHPTDWAHIELTKDLEGRYIFANPQALAGPTLWGLPVVPTQAMAVGNFLTGAFAPAAQIFDREDANVQVSYDDADNFTKNLVTVRAEERLALAIYRPEALVKGIFDGWS